MTHVPTTLHTQSECFIMIIFPSFLANCDRLEKKLLKRFNCYLYTAVNACTCQNKLTFKNFFVTSGHLVNYLRCMAFETTLTVQLL